VVGEHAGFEPGTSNYKECSEQLDRLQVRTQLLLKALRGFYASIGLFGAAALVSVVGSIVTYYGRNILFQLDAGLALVTGFLAVLGLASGCVLMGRETRLAVRNLAEEANIRIKRR
jgi:hypothetical protein